MLTCLSCPALADDFWARGNDGEITHHFKNDGPPVVLCMQGRKVVMQVEVDGIKGFSHKTCFFNVPAGRVDMGKAIFEGGSDLIPEIQIEGKPMAAVAPAKAGFDGMLTLTYPENGGIVPTRTIYPSMTQALVLDERRLRNTSTKSIGVSVKSTRIERREGEKLLMIWQTPAVEATTVKPGEIFTFHASLQARLTDEPDLVVDVSSEREARRAVANAAWNGPGRLETPDPDLDIAYASLNEASMNMYRIWLDHCRKHGIDPFPGSFEHVALKLTQRWRGDDAMVSDKLWPNRMQGGDILAASDRRETEWGRETYYALMPPHRRSYQMSGACILESRDGGNPNSRLKALLK